MPIFSKPLIYSKDVLEWLRNSDLCKYEIGLENKENPKKRKKKKMKILHNQILQTLRNISWEFILTFKLNITIEEK